MAKNKITFERFLEISKELEIKLGTIEVVERIPKSKKMLRLEVNFGEESRVQVLTNVGDKLLPIQLQDKQFPFITNLEPANIMGYDSYAMIVIPAAPDGEISSTYITKPDGSILI